MNNRENDDELERMEAFTDEDGHYSFRVPITDMTDPVEPYRYRVRVTQPDGMLYEWTAFRSVEKREDDCDVLPASDFLDLSAEAIKDWGEQGEGMVIGRYDPLDLASGNTDSVPGATRRARLGRTLADTGEPSPIGNVVGMIGTHKYNVALSAEFSIYTPPEGDADTPATLADGDGDETHYIDFSRAQDDLTQDAGLFIPEEPEPEPQQKSNTGTLLLILAVAVLGGGAGWYFKIYRPKHEKAAVPEEDYSEELADYDDPEDDGPPWDEDDTESEDNE